MDSTRYDKAVVNLGYVCNVAQMASSEPDDDKIIMSLILKVEEHPGQEANNTKDWVSAGIMFHPTKMWVGQLALYATNLTDMLYYGVGTWSLRLPIL